MSSVTSILLTCVDVGSCTLGQRSIVEELNEWLLNREPRRLNLFEKLDGREVGGGDKVPQQSVIWAGFDGFHSHEELVQWFRNYPWEYPENAVLVIDTDYNEATRVYRPELPSYHQHDPAKWEF